MLSGITITCFAASYAVALALELVALRQRFRWHRPLLVAFTFAGLLAHSLFLFRDRTATTALPLSTTDWLLWAAWLIAIVYFAALFYLPRTPTGIVLLPIALVLIFSTRWASTEPFASAESLRVWASIHGVMLLAGAVTVCIGFLAGLMYLLQSYALKHARSSANGLRLPSLEWLERVNSRTLAFSALMIALGFISGIVMSIAKHRGEATYVLWTDPVVLSLAAMMIWLFAAEVFRLIYPAARRGRKVAYLTLASFVFLVIALVSFTLLDSVHGTNRRAASDPKSELPNPKSQT